MMLWEVFHGIMSIYWLSLLIRWLIQPCVIGFIILLAFMGVFVKFKNGLISSVIFMVLLGMSVGWLYYYQPPIPKVVAVTGSGFRVRGHGMICPRGFVMPDPHSASMESLQEFSTGQYVRVQGKELYLSTEERLSVYAARQGWGTANWRADRELKAATKAAKEEKLGVWQYFQGLETFSGI